MESLYLCELGAQAHGHGREREMPLTLHSACDAPGQRMHFARTKIIIYSTNFDARNIELCLNIDKQYGSFPLLTFFDTNQNKI